MSSVPLKEIKKLDWSSRKYRTAWKLTIILMVMFVVPVLVSFVVALMGQSIQFTLIPVEYFVPLFLGIWGTYFGVNVVEKLPKLRKDKKIEQVTMIEDTGKGTGGQPEKSIGNEP